MPRAFPFKRLLLVLLYAVGLSVLGYGIPRTDFVLLFTVYSAVFGIFLLLYRKLGSDLNWILAVGLLLRLLLFGMEPKWSDDVYRFVWDGRIVANGGDPYEKKPLELLDTELGDEAELDTAFWERLNSPEYFSVYPPVDQMIFAGTAYLAGSDTYRHTLLMRGVILLADLVILLLSIRLLTHFGFPREASLLYILNPLVIMEGVGNLHFEPLMLAFLFAALYLLLVKGRWLFSAVLYGLAISTKLIPLIFLPFFIKRMRLQVLPFFLVIGGTVLLSFLPWLSMDTLQHFGTSLNLYFQTFEFNGSIYSLVRWAGFQWVGYNIIEDAGPVLSGIVFFGVLALAFFGDRGKKGASLFTLFTLALSLHLFLATTVHPWYLLPLLAFLPFTSYRFPLLWSFLVVLSYAAYGYGGELPSWVLFIEYGLLFVMVGRELFVRKLGLGRPEMPRN